MHQYKDFTIKFKPSNDGIHEVKISSPAGDDSSTFTMPFTNTLLRQMLSNLSQSVGSIDLKNVERGVGLRSGAKKMVDPKDIGVQLFDQLFQGRCRSLFDESLVLLRESNTGLRIRLYINPEESSLRALSRLPWELMYRTKTKEYLNLSIHTPLVRYLEVPRPITPIPFRGPLRILVVISNPRSVAALDLDRERQLIKESWGLRHDIQVDFLETATKAALQSQLAALEYHVLHFMGHGDFDEETGEGVLILEEENGSPSNISGNALGLLLRDEASLRVVFLNACNTAQDTGKKDHDPFSGVASGITMAGVPVVIAMQFPITDGAAITFADQFYKMLPDGHPVDYIVTEARKAIYLKQPQSTEWATPVLFMRAPDGIVFDSTFKLQPVSPEQQKGLSRLTGRVIEFWIDGKLESDIPYKPAISLSKELAPNAVQQAFEGNTALPENAEKPVPERVSISALFDQVERSLLILGQPGYGKSVTLLLLAQGLIQRHEQDPSHHPIPVVLFLSTWTKKFTSIKDWVVEEVSQKYKIPPANCRKWLQSGRLILMLDGLDEVNEKDQKACVEALNQFVEEQRNDGFPIGLAVCCREEDYLKLHPSQFLFEEAIKLLPLNENQIRGYLEQAGEKMAGLQTLLEQDSQLLKEAKSPLMLSMMSIAYQLAPDEFIISSDESPSGIVPNRSHLLAEKYVDHVFIRKGKRQQAYSKEMTIRHLSWLATRMKKHNHSVFLMEGLQPSWLSTPLERVANMALYSLILGSILALVLNRIWYASDLVDPADPLANTTQPYWWIIIPIWTFLAVLWDSWKPPFLKLISKDIKLSKKILVSAANVLVYLFFYMGLWLLLWTIIDIPEDLVKDIAEPERLSAWLTHTIVSGVFLTALYGLRVSLRNHNNYVGASESLKWSWSGSVKGLLFGLAGGLVLWSIYYFFAIETYGSETVWRNLKFYPPVCGLIGSLFNGFKMGLAKTKSKPNEGIRLALRNGLLGAVIIGPIIGLGVIPIMKFFLIDSLPTDPLPHVNYLQENIPLTAFWVGLMASIVGFLWFGGFDAIRHYALRLVISFSQKIPLHLGQFLDHAAELILLQRVGGGYIFQNRLLLDYFDQKAQEEKGDEKG